VTDWKTEFALAVASAKSSARAGDQPVSAADSAFLSFAGTTETPRRHNHLPRTNHTSGSGDSLSHIRSMLQL